MEAFRKHLKKRGKKEHVVEGLVAQVEQFADFLDQGGADLASATAENLLAFAERIEDQKTGTAKKAVWGIALYYDFVGRDDLATLASNIRQKAIAKTRKAFALKDFRGTDAAVVAKLAAVGIVNVKQMLQVGKTGVMRAKLAHETGVPEESILELVKLSDLARLPGVKGIRARLYYDAGVDSVVAMAGWEPDALLTITAEFVERTNFDGIAPLPKEVSSTIATATKLPPLVEY